MKLNVRHAVWALALAFTVTVLSAPSIAAPYQSEQGLEHGRGQDKNNPRAGINPDGSPADATYIPNTEQGGWSAPVTPQQISPPGPLNRQYGPNGHRPYGNNIQNVAYNNGFQEGLGYRRTDRTAGHSTRPTYSSTYKKGTNGYNSSYGNLTKYKNTFQEGFRAGYAQGYNEGYGR